MGLTHFFGTVSAIGKFNGVTPEEYLADSKNFFNYTWEIKGKTMGADDPKPLLFPNGWVEDAVSLGIAGQTEWTVVSPLLDCWIHQRIRK